MGYFWSAPLGATKAWVPAFGEHGDTRTECRRVITIDTGPIQWQKCAGYPQERHFQSMTSAVGSHLTNSGGRRGWTCPLEVWDQSKAKVGPTPRSINGSHRTPSRMSASSNCQGTTQACSQGRSRETQKSVQDNSKSCTGMRGNTVCT